MGCTNSRMCTGGTSQAKVVMLGLDSAGKTAILYRLRLNETVTTIPTVGFNVETVAPMKDLSFTVWDLGGTDNHRPLWRHFYKDTDGLIFVVDSSNQERISEAKKELFNSFDSDELRGVPVCVLANKQDLPNALIPSELREQLNLQKLKDREWHVQAACAKTGKGLYEGMLQLAFMVKEFKKSGHKR